MQAFLIIIHTIVSILLVVVILMQASQGGGLSGTFGSTTTSALLGGRGAGGAQMFKDSEKGDKEVNVERTEQALETKPEIIAAGCPFCNTMMTDGVKIKEKEDSVKVMDIAELIANAQDL